MQTVFVNLFFCNLEILDVFSYDRVTLLCCQLCFVSVMATHRDVYAAMMRLCCGKFQDDDYIYDNELDEKFLKCHIIAPLLRQIDPDIVEEGIDIIPLVNFLEERNDYVALDNLRHSVINCIDTPLETLKNRADVVVEMFNLAFRTQTPVEVNYDNLHERLKILLSEAASSDNPYIFRWFVGMNAWNNYSGNGTPVHHVLMREAEESAMYKFATRCLHVIHDAAPPGVMETSPPFFTVSSWVQAGRNYLTPEWKSYPFLRARFRHP